MRTGPGGAPTNTLPNQLMQTPEFREQVARIHSNTTLSESQKSVLLANYIPKAGTPKPDQSKR